MPFLTTATVYRFRGEWESVPAVYGVLNSKRQLIFIGQTDDMHREMAALDTDDSHCIHRFGPSLVWMEVLKEGEAARAARLRQLVADYPGVPCNRGG